MQSVHLFNVLANTHFLASKTLNYHWNVKGKDFPQLHSMFEDQYKELIGSLDDMGERIRAIGESVPEFKDEHNKIGPVMFNAEADVMVKDLMHSHQEMLKLINLIDLSHDRITSSLMDGKLFAHEKTIWMLSSVLHIY